MSIVAPPGTKSMTDSVLESATMDMCDWFSICYTEADWFCFEI